MRMPGVGIGKDADFGLCQDGSGTNKKGEAEFWGPNGDLPRKKKMYGAENTMRILVKTGMSNRLDRPSPWDHNDSTLKIYLY